MSPLFIVETTADCSRCGVNIPRNPEIRYRITQGLDPRKWGPLQRIELPKENLSATYANIYKLREGFGPSGRLFCFFRATWPYTPQWIYSDDDGNSWTRGGELITHDLEGNHRPYVRYTSNDSDTIHFAFTEAHPRAFPRTSIYYAQMKANAYCKADGETIKPLEAGSLAPSEATRIFQGDENHVAWVTDIRLSPEGHPTVLYSVRHRSGKSRSWCRRSR